MASDLPALWLATYSRAVADTGTGGLFNVGTPLITGFYNTRAPAAATYPYAVYQVEASEKALAFRTNGWTRHVAMHVYTQVVSDGTLGLNRGALIMERLEGDWDAQTLGTGPTYGFNRFKPTLTNSGWTADIFELQDSREEHDENVYHWIMQFTINNWKAAA